MGRNRKKGKKKRYDKIGPENAASAAVPPATAIASGHRLGAGPEESGDEEVSRTQVNTSTNTSNTTTTTTTTPAGPSSGLETISTQHATAGPAEHSITTGRTDTVATRPGTMDKDRAGDSDIDIDRDSDDIQLVIGHGLTTAAGSMNDDTNTRPPIWKGMLGMILMSGSAFTFSIASLFVHVLGQHIPSFSIVFLRSWMLWALSLAYLKYKGLPLFPPGQIKLMIFRGVLGTGAVTCVFYAFTVMQIADATVVVFTAPILTLFLGRVVLGEKTGWVEVACGVTALTGVVLVARPVFLFGSGDHDKGVASPALRDIAIAWAGAWFSASTNIVVRKLKALEPQQVLHSFAVVASVLTPIIALVIGGVQVPNTGTLWLELVVIGLFSYLAQVFKTTALQLDAAGPVAMMRNLDIVFAFIWQVTLIGEPVALWSVAGALCITLSSIVVGWRKYRRIQKAQHGRGYGGFAVLHQEDGLGHGSRSSSSSSSSSVDSGAEVDIERGSSRHSPVASTWVT